MPSHDGRITPKQPSDTMEVDNIINSARVHFKPLSLGNKAGMRFIKDKILTIDEMNARLRQIEQAQIRLLRPKWMKWRGLLRVKHVNGGSDTNV